MDCVIVVLVQHKRNKRGLPEVKVFSNMIQAGAYVDRMKDQHECTMVVSRINEV